MRTPTQTFVFTNLPERLANLGRRVVDKLDLCVDRGFESVDWANESINGVQAQAVDWSRRKFSERHRTCHKQKAAASTVSTIVGVFTMGTGSGIVGVARGVYDEMFDAIIDSTDTKHVLRAVYGGSEMASDGLALVESFARDKLRSCVNASLVDAVKDYGIPDAYVGVAAIIKVSVVTDEPDACRRLLSNGSSVALSSSSRSSVNSVNLVAGSSRD